MHDAAPAFIVAASVGQTSENKKGRVAITDHPASPTHWERDELVRALIDTAVDGIIVIDAQGVIQHCNSSTELLFGYDRAEMVGRDIDMLMPTPHRGKHDSGLQNDRRSGDKRVIDIGREDRGRRKDGSVFPMHLSVGEGRLHGAGFFVGYVRDLSDLKREQEARDEANQLLASVVQSSDDAIISKTLDGIITSWNAAAIRTFGYSEAEAVGRHISMLFPPELLAEEESILAELRAGRQVQQYETLRRHKHGRDIPVSLSVAPVRDRDGKVIGASKIARDISARVASDSRNLALQKELAHVARLSAMGQMSAAIAHELNQPLTAVTNYVKAASRLLAGEAPTPQQIASARDAMEKAAGQTIRAGSIIRYLRDFVEKRESEKEPQDLNRVIREAIDLTYAGTLPGTVRPNITLAPDIPPVLLDKVQIQQVLVNLIRNSLEAMAGQGGQELTITSAWLRPDTAQMVIRDNGPGLPPLVREKLFQPFVTTKSDGMGIGLKICQSIIEAHNGTIRALDENRQGTAFEIRLPLAGGAGHAA